MSKFPRTTKQFDFLMKPVLKLDQTTRSLVRRTDYRGVPFDDGVGAEATIESDMPEIAVKEPLKEISLSWDTEAEGYEITGPTYITFTLDDMAMLKFKVGEQFHYVWYSNARYFIDVLGIIERE